MNSRAERKRRKAVIDELPRIKSDVGRMYQALLWGWAATAEHYANKLDVSKNFMEIEDRQGMIRTEDPEIVWLIISVNRALEINYVAVVPWIRDTMLRAVYPAAFAVLDNIAADLSHTAQMPEEIDQARAFDRCANPYCIGFGRERHLGSRRRGRHRNPNADYCLICENTETELNSYLKANPYKRRSPGEPVYPNTHTTRRDIVRKWWHHDRYRALVAQYHPVARSELSSSESDYSDSES